MLQNVASEKVLIKFLAFQLEFRSNNNYVLHVRF